MAPRKKATKQLRSKRDHSEVASADETPSSTKKLKTTIALDDDSDDDILSSSAPRIEPKTAEEQQAVRQKREENEAALDTQHVRFDAATRRAIPQKMMVKRRRTLSPALAGGRMQHFKISGRKSLPIAVDKQDRYNSEQLHFSPLRSVLDERMRKIEREQSSPVNSVSYVPSQDQIGSDDEDMLVLDDEQAQQPSQQVMDTDTTDIRLVQDRIDEHDMNLNHKQCEIERARLEESILRLSAEVSEAKSKLHIYELEILALGFGAEDGESPVHALRDALQRFRDGLSKVLPSEVTLDASNPEHLDIVSQSLQDFVEQWETQQIQLNENADVITTLRSDHNTLLQKLAAHKVIKQDLERELNRLAESDDAKQRQITELQISLNTEKGERAQAEQLVADLNAQLAESEDQNDDQQHGLDRLNESLQRYRHEEHRLQDLISRMEEEHSSKIEELRRSKEDSIEEYKKKILRANEQIHEHRQHLEEAESKIETLEHKQAEYSKERKSLLKKVSSLDAELETAQKSYDDAVADLDAANDILNATAGEYESLFANAEDTSDVSDVSSVSPGVGQAKHSHRLEGSISKMSLTAGKFRKEFQSLRLSKASLERRVESEAEAMLEMQSQRDEEIAQLREALQDKHAKTLVVEQKAKEADRRWQDLYDSRTEELRRLRVENDLTHDELVDVRENYTQLKSAFKAYIEDTTNRLHHLHADESTALRNIERHQKGNNEAARQYEKQMDEINVDVAVAQEILHEAEILADLPATKKHKQSRNYDSGFGVASDEME